MKWRVFALKNPKLDKNNIDVFYDNKYLSLYGLHFDNGQFYLEASRRKADNLVVCQDEESYDNMLPDAVTCVLVIKTPGEEPRLYLEREFRYPAGHFLLSPPAGLIDPKDGENGDARIIAAIREIHEETGAVVKDTDKIYVASPLFFSTPGMTDESNAIVVAEVNMDDLSGLNSELAEGSECFGDYALLTKAEAKKLIKQCRDEDGRYFSIFTWCVLMYFVYEMEE